MAVERLPDRGAAGAEPSCAACDGGPLRSHLAVAGDAGPAGLIPTTDRFGTALSDIVRCARCGHGQLERMPAAATLAAAYADAASGGYLAEEAGQRATARIALERIERYAPPGALVDLGCWVGFLLAEARQRGWRTTGVEPSAFAAAHARDALGLDVIEADLLSASLPEDAFDAAVLGDVLEHLVDPAHALGLIERSLTPNGVVYLALPDAGSRVARVLGARWWSVLPTHLHYFTRGSLIALLARCGWRPLWIGTAPKVFSAGYYLSRIGGYAPAAGRALVAAARAAGVAERPWAPDLRDRMAVVARAPRAGARSALQHRR